LNTFKLVFFILGFQIFICLSSYLGNHNMAWLIPKWLEKKDRFKWKVKISNSENHQETNIQSSILELPCFHHF